MPLCSLERAIKGSSKLEELEHVFVVQGTTGSRRKPISFECSFSSKVIMCGKCHSVKSISH